MAARRILLTLALGLAWSLAWSGDRSAATVAAQAGDASTPVASPKVHPRVIADTADGQSARVLVLLANQLDPRPAAAIRDPAARGWYVYDGLRRAAATSQANVRALLDARGVPYRDYWAANALALTADRALA